MKSIKISAKEAEDYKEFGLEHLEKYFGYPTRWESGGCIILRDNSNYYTPISVLPCSKEEATLHFYNNRKRCHIYYKTYTNTNI